MNKQVSHVAFLKDLKGSPLTTKKNATFPSIILHAFLILVPPFLLLASLCE